MAVTHRIKRLEQRLGAALSGGCPACHGRGLPGLAIVRSERDIDTRVKGCHACGRVSSVAKMIILPPPDAGPEWDPWEVI